MSPNIGVRTVVTWHVLRISKSNSIQVHPWNGSRWIEHFARWIKQILPFSLVLLLVFIRQHLHGFSVMLWIAAVIFKSNDILKKQTAPKSIPTSLYKPYKNKKFGYKPPKSIGISLSKLYKISGFSTVARSFG